MATECHTLSANADIYAFFHIGQMAPEFYVTYTLSHFPITLYCVAVNMSIQFELMYLTVTLME